MGHGLLAVAMSTTVAAKEGEKANMLSFAVVPSGFGTRTHTSITRNSSGRCSSALWMDAGSAPITWVGSMPSISTFGPTSARKRAKTRPSGSSACGPSSCSPSSPEPRAMTPFGSPPARATAGSTCQATAFSA